MDAIREIPDLPKSRKTRRLLWCVGILLVAAGTLAGVYGILIWDESPPEDSDLRPVRAEIPEGENGFTLVDLREEDVELSSAERKDRCNPESDDWDPELASEAVEKNAKVLERYEESLRRPAFQVPEIATMVTPVRYILAWRKISDLVSARVGLALEAGEESSAFESALDLVRFGGRIQKGKGDLTVFLVGVALQMIGANQFTRIVAKSELDEEETEAFIAEFERLIAPDEGWDDTVRVEWAKTSHFFDEFTDGRAERLVWENGNWFLNLLPVRRVIFHRNSTKRAFVEVLRGLMGPWSRTKAERVMALEKEKPTSFWPPMNLLGRTLVAMLLPTIGLDSLKRGLLPLHSSIPRLLFALKRFEEERGDLPDSLTDLTPRYLKEVPIDPFDGRPLRFSKEKRIVYSVGKDGIDSGGESSHEEGSAPTDDISWKLDF